MALYVYWRMKPWKLSVTLPHHSWLHNPALVGTDWYSNIPTSGDWCFGFACNEGSLPTLMELLYMELNYPRWVLSKTPYSSTHGRCLSELVQIRRIPVVVIQYNHVLSCIIYVESLSPHPFSPHFCDPKKLKTCLVFHVSAKHRLPRELTFLKDRPVYQVLLQIQPFHRIGETLPICCRWELRMSGRIAIFVVVELAKVVAESMFFVPLWTGCPPLPKFFKGSVGNSMWLQRGK